LRLSRAHDAPLAEDMIYENGLVSGGSFKPEAQFCLKTMRPIPLRTNQEDWDRILDRLFVKFRANPEPGKNEASLQEYRHAIAEAAGD
jgi:hypothetical protein